MSTANDGLKRTACHDEHVALDAQMVDFHGYALPMWYSSIKQEHLACRSAAGLFDVSHMGFFRLSGPNVDVWLESLATQQVSAIPAGRCGYTHLLDERGRIIDDMIFAVTDADQIRASGCSDWSEQGEAKCILGVPNASMIDTMRDWFESHPGDGILLEDLSESTSILALQGPKAPEILSAVLGEQNTVGRFRAQAIQANDLGISGWIQGTGYTGERGCEIFVANEDAALLWGTLLDRGAESDLVPVGLGARDTLRLEKGYLLSGQDFSWPELAGGDEHQGIAQGRSSIETQVPFGLHLGHEFIGRQAMLDSDSGLRWWGLRYEGRGPSPRPGRLVLSENDPDSPVLGEITSGGPSPSLENAGIAMAYLTGVEEGDIVYVAASPRKRVTARIVTPPFL